MSHFVVVVFGEDIDGQLDAYDENKECNPEPRLWMPDEVERFLQFYSERDNVKSYTLDSLKEDKELFLSMLGDWTYVSEVAPEPDILEGYDGNLTIRTYSTYNPESKWDWYQVGGRWSGFFKLKKGAPGFMGERSWTNEKLELPEGRADIALKKDVDFDGMREEERVNAETLFDKIEKIGSTAPASALKDFIPWDKFRSKFKKMDTARDKYALQPLVKVFREAAKEDSDLRWWDCGPEEVYAEGRESYVNRMVASAISPYALLIDRQWVGKGDMGWWGVGSNEKEQNDWNATVAHAFEEAYDDEILTAVDCHI